MAKEKEVKTTPQGEPAGAVSQERPNRDRYAAMFAEDNPDIDFEDKENRYSRMSEEREDYRNLRSSGRELTKQLEGNHWLGAMIQDLARNPDKNPLVWLTENGIDVKAALDDPEVMAQVDEKFKNWQQKQVDGEAAEKAKDAAVDESLEALAQVQNEYGLTDEQFDRLWENFWDNVFAPAFQGKVTKDTWVAMMHAMNYDQDIANAREESAMQARNEKHANKVKTYDEQQVPPSFSQSGGQRVAPQRQKRESLRDFVMRNT